MVGGPGIDQRGRERGLAAKCAATACGNGPGLAHDRENIRVPELTDFLPSPSDFRT